MIGKTLGHYRILEKIGAGGMGEVYRAHDEHLDRDVAIKVLPAGMLADEAARKRFRKEAEALSKLNHPHIATVHDFDTQAPPAAGQAGVDFLVMEYVLGPTLAEKSALGPLAEKEVVALGSQMAAALEEAHEHGIVHRDLKPGNIKLTPKAQVKVLDFGLAKLRRPITEAATTESFTETQAVAGTLPYMAPEQLRGESADARTDLWAAGAVLYELATARRPFEAKLATALAADIQTKPLTPPSQLNPKLSPRLEEIILKCLEKDPENRYQSAKELAVDLRRLAAPPVPISPRLGPRGWTWRAWRVGGAGLIAAVVLLAAVLVGLNVGGWRERLLGGPSRPQIESLAVLPLKNLMGDPQQEYFVEGMHEALITELSKIGALKVISRTSAMRYKDSNKPLPQIARELKVDAVVEGSVLREGDMVRISVQLIEGATDKHLWAENYDRPLGDVLALHSEVARGVANEIKVTLTPQEQTRLARARTVNPDAYEAFLRGRYHWNKRTTAGFRKAVEYFEAAIEKEPTYAPAYAGLADAYSTMGWFGVLPPQEAWPKVKGAAVKALEIDEGLADAHTALGTYKFFYEWNWAGARQAFERAIELNPNYALAHQRYSQFLIVAGQAGESLAEINRALELDPLSRVIQQAVAFRFYCLREYDRAIEQCRKVLAEDPNFLLARLRLGMAYEQKRMSEEALAELQKTVSLSGGDPMYLAALGHAYAVSGRRRDARKTLAELDRLRRRRYISPYWLAVIHVGLGENEQAWAWLERAYQEHATWLVEHLKLDPRLDPLRSHPRFRGLLRRMNFPQ